MKLTTLFLATILSVNALSAADSGEPLSGSHNKEKQPPNVLFISIDDMNHWISGMREYQDIYDYPAYKTPNIDKLLQRGMFFTSAHVPASSCKPSRVSTFTGRNVISHGVYRNPHEWLISPILKGRDDISLMQRFRKEGYWVAGGGKNFHGVHEASWDEFLGRTSPKLPPEEDARRRELSNIFSKAMEEMYQRRDAAKGSKADREAAKVNGNKKDDAVVWGWIDAPDEAMPDSRMVDYIIKQLNKKHDKPFYLGVGFHKPHMPWSVPKKYFDMYPLDEIPTPVVKEDDWDDLGNQGKSIAGGSTHEYMLKTDQWKKAIQGYLATCTYTDVQIGRLMEAFDKSPHKDNTIIVMWSDHGWHLGDKNHWKKFTLWEETTHVPMFIAAPGITKPGQKCDRVVGSIDLYPTLLELCGFAPNKTLDGNSLVPLLKNPKKEWNHPVLTTHSRGYNAIRTEKWRYIQYPKDGEEELYDRLNDPLEHHNLANNPDYTEVLEELRAHVPEQQAEEVVQVANVVRNVQLELLNRKKKIGGPTYSEAQKKAYAAVLACEPGKEEEVARTIATEIFSKAIAAGVYNPENLTRPTGGIAQGKEGVLNEKKKKK